MNYLKWALFEIALLLLPGFAYADNLISRAIETAQPCRSLKVKSVVGSIGIDKFKEANIERLNLQIEGSQATLTGTAMLTCQTSENAVIKGDVSATVSMNAALDLNFCEMNRLDVEMVKTGGTFKDVLDVLKNNITGTMKGAIAKELKKLCD